MAENDEKPVVLVVDDTPDNLTLIAGLLKPSYRVKVAPSGDRALAICSSTPPDLVLLDVVMPGLDGLEVCRRLKANPATSPIPVVFLSGLGTDGDRARGAEAGGAGFLLKPVEPLLLLETVRLSLEQGGPASATSTGFEGTLNPSS